MPYKNKEDQKTNNKKWRDENREHCLAQSRKYYEENREHHLSVGKKWKENNRERCKEVNKKYWEEHPEQHRVNTKKWNKANRSKRNELKKRSQLKACKNLTDMYAKQVIRQLFGLKASEVTPELIAATKLKLLVYRSSLNKTTPEQEKEIDLLFNQLQQTIKEVA